MALTIASTTPQSGDVWGRQKTRIVTVTFDSSYPTGGESFTPADVGLSEFTFVSPSVDANSAERFVVHYDYTDETLVVLGVEQDADAAVTVALDEANSTDNLALLVIRVLCVGH